LFWNLAREVVVVACIKRLRECWFGSFISVPCRLASDVINSGMLILFITREHINIVLLMLLGILNISIYE